MNDIAITINIPPDVFAAIKARAKAQGVAWPAVASSLLQHIVLHHREIFGEEIVPS
jgi:predicted DNA binding CopG/RHH family protein